MPMRRQDVYGKRDKKFAQIEEPGTVDKYCRQIDQSAGRQVLYHVPLPFADLLLSKPYDELIDGVLEAKHIGR
jgi:hypothetical protein